MPMALTRISQMLRGALNGVVGDYLHQTKNPLAINMELVGGGAALDGAEKDICLFIHGSAAEEGIWESGKDFSYGRSLHRDFGLEPVYLRYNSGLHIRENGKMLAALLERRFSNHRGRLFVVGHSMGGLVFRSAAHYALGDGHTWPRHIRQVFYLGSPHYGAPLEKAGALAESLLKSIPSPYTGLAARLIGLRSKGIRDLRHGSLHDNEWQEASGPASRDRNGAFRHLQSAEHFLVAGSWLRDPASVPAAWLGDIMVNTASATARNGAGHLAVAPHQIRVFGGHHHVRLLHSPDIYRWISEKIALDGAGLPRKTA